MINRWQPDLTRSFDGRWPVRVRFMQDEDPALLRRVYEDTDAKRMAEAFYMQCVREALVSTTTYHKREATFQNVRCVFIKNFKQEEMRVWLNPKLLKSRLDLPAPDLLLVYSASVETMADKSTFSAFYITGWNTWRGRAHNGEVYDPNLGDYKYGIGRMLGNHPWFTAGEADDVYMRLWESDDPSQPNDPSNGRYIGNALAGHFRYEKYYGFNPVTAQDPQFQPPFYSGIAIDIKRMREELGVTSLRIQQSSFIENYDDTAPTGQWRQTAYFLGYLPFPYPGYDPDEDELIYDGSGNAYGGPVQVFGTRTAPDPSLFGTYPYDYWHSEWDALTNLYQSTGPFNVQTTEIDELVGGIPYPCQYNLKFYSEPELQLVNPTPFGNEFGLFNMSVQDFIESATPISQYTDIKQMINWDETWYNTPFYDRIFDVSFGKDDFANPSVGAGAVSPTSDFLRSDENQDGDFFTWADFTEGFYLFPR